MTTIDIAALNKVDDITNANVGDYVSCDYTYDEGFSNFGLGSIFNFICVKSTINESIFISDRVIENLSFDDINKKGFIYGKEIEPYEGSLSKFLVKSLSGYNNGFGCEYEKYVVNSNLGELITAGDSNIWNSTASTITSSIVKVGDNASTIENILIESQEHTESEKVDFNGSFEETTTATVAEELLWKDDIKPKFWEVQKYKNNEVTSWNSPCGEVVSDAKDGNNAVKLVLNNSIGFFKTVTGSSPKIEPGKWYKLSTYIKTENLNGKSILVKVEQLDKNNNILESKDIGTVSEASDWTNISGIIISNENVDKLRIVVQNKLLNDPISGSVYLDDFTLEGRLYKVDNSRVVTRGGSNIATISNCTLGGKSESSGFRPMLVVSRARSNPSFSLGYEMGVSDNLYLCIKDIFVHKDHKYAQEVYTINVYSGENKIYSNEYTFIEGESIDIILGVSGFVDNSINEVTVELVDSFGLNCLTHFKAYRVSDNIILFRDCYTSSIIHNKLNRKYAMVNVEYSQASSIVVAINNDDYKIINIGDVFEVNCEPIHLMVFTNNSDVSIDALGVVFIEHEL